METWNADHAGEGHGPGAAAAGGQQGGPGTPARGGHDGVSGAGAVVELSVHRGLGPVQDERQRGLCRDRARDEQQSGQGEALLLLLQPPLSHPPPAVTTAFQPQQQVTHSTLWPPFPTSTKPNKNRQYPTNQPTNSIDTLPPTWADRGSSATAPQQGIGQRQTTGKMGGRSVVLYEIELPHNHYCLLKIQSQAAVTNFHPFRPNKMAFPPHQKILFSL